MKQLEKLMKVTKARCEASDGFNLKIDDWTIADWMCGLAGETGELANEIKKLRRHELGVKKEKRSKEEIMKAIESEIPDVLIYLMMICNKLDVDPWELTRKKFNEVCDKLGYSGERL